MTMAKGQMQPGPEEMPLPGVEDAFQFHLTFAPAVAVGRLGTGGHREIFSVTEGRVAGGRLSGTILSGSETRLVRGDGVTIVEAVYLVSASDGALIRVIGTGFDAETESFSGTQMTIVFEADDDGAHGWLATRAFLARRPAGASVLAVSQIV